MILKLGDAGPKVKELQELLFSHGFKLSLDGVFGPTTQRCVKEFQSQKFLVSDGIVGPITWKFLEGPSHVESPDSLSLRKSLIKIARKDEGYRETSKNHGPAIVKFWPATSYLEGYQNREPYCAAAICYWVKEWLRLPEVLQYLEKTPEEAEKWRPKTAAAFGFIEWADDHGIMTFENGKAQLGDLCVFSFSHIGIVIEDLGDSIRTLDANTGATSGNDGDGIYEKIRSKSLVKKFIRILK